MQLVFRLQLVLSGLQNWYNTCAGVGLSKDCECNPLTPFSAAEISISFESPTRLGKGDFISLHLPGFSVRNMQDLWYHPVTSSHPKSFKNASWTQNSSILKIEIEDTVDAEIRTRFCASYFSGTAIADEWNAREFCVAAVSGNSFSRSKYSWIVYER